jgi:hypothetical protein
MVKCRQFARCTALSTGNAIRLSHATAAAAPRIGQGSTWSTPQRTVGAEPMIRAAIGPLVRGNLDRRVAITAIAAGRARAGPQSRTLPGRCKVSQPSGRSGNRAHPVLSMASSHRIAARSGDGQDHE